MKRFWKVAAATEAEGGWSVQLDGKPLRTPARAPLVIPTRPLADAIVAEWQSAPDEFEPRDMPLTGLANAAIDRVASDPPAFARSLAQYGETDLTCYRAQTPAALAAAQAQAWDHLLAWARRRFDVDFRTTDGIVHVAQPSGTVKQLAHAVGALDPFRLSGLHPLVTISGSLVAALALLERAISVDECWQAASVDDRWQLDQWGSDFEAEARLNNQRLDFLNAARFLELLEP